MNNESIISEPAPELSLLVIFLQGGYDELTGTHSDEIISKFKLDQCHLMPVAAYSNEIQQERHQKKIR